MQEPLRTVVGFFGATEAAQQMLEGTYVCPPGTDDFTRFFVECLKATAQREEPVSVTIATDDYINYWKKVREATLSSYSGLHFGHWKAATQDQWLSELHALSIEIPYSTGYSLRRWQAGLSAMLEKKAGVIMVDKLRAILLMEADFNFANKLIFGSRMMEVAMEEDEIPPEVFGSIKNREAIEAATCRRLIADLSRMTRTPMAISSVDAQTCYDRMVHSIASICCQRWKVPKEAILAALGTIQKMKFYLRTNFGDSTTYYGGGEQGLPFQGGCQGNGGAPALWVAISVILIRVLREHGHVVEWTSAISQTVTMLIGFLFVDDTDLIVMGEDATASPETIIQRMQDNITTWYNSLNLSGGALRPDKCSWYLLAYHWKPSGQWVYHTAESLPGKLFVPNLEGTPESIQRHDPSTETTAVGVTQAMDGSMTAQLELLKNKADEWSASIREGYLPRNLAWSALRQNIWASLKYPLPACNFSPQEADSILRCFYKTLLPGLGVCRNIPKAIRHAPRSFYGLDLPDPFTAQGIGQLKYFTTNAHLPNLLGGLHRACLEQANIEVGLGCIFEAPFSTYGFLLTTSLVKSIWEFISMNEIVLEGEIAHPELQRIGDEYLMKIFVESTLWMKRELIGMNRVRIDLQVYSVADISDGEGKHICDWAFGMRKAPERESKWRWPREAPGGADKRAWRKGLALLRDPDYGFTSSKFHLGDWVIPTHRKQWQWRYDSSQKILYGYFLNRYWRKYVPRSNRHPRKGSIFIREGFSLAPPAHNTELATVTVYSTNEVRFEGSAAPGTTATTTNYRSIEHLRDSWKDRWPIDLADFPNNGETVANAIREDRAQGGCDGSYKAERAADLGAAAWLLEDSNKVRSPALARDSCCGVVRTSGTRDEVNAYRSELQGVHALFLAIKLLCIYHKITSGSIRLACDNKVAADLAAEDETKVSANRSHVDLIRAIRALKAELPVTIYFTHVYGHQDNSTALEHLSRKAQINVLVDSIAKEWLDKLLVQRESQAGLAPCNDSIAGEGWTIHINGVKLTGNPTEPLRKHIHAKPLRDYMHKKGILDATAFSLVDWKASERTMNEAAPLYRLWAAKHVHGWCAVGTRMKQWKFQASSTCPCCQHAEEASRHIVTCPDPRMRSVWLEKLQGLEVWMTDNDTAPAIQHCILTTLKTGDPHTRFTDNSEVLTQQAAEEQDLIGWHNLMEGRITSQWRETQCLHYRRIASHRSADRWAAGFVANLLEITHSLWIQRNEVVHEKHANGLLLEEAKELEESIREQYQLGNNELHDEDKWLLEQEIEEILSLPGHDQQTWLAEITLAREEHAEALAYSTMQED